MADYATLIRPRCCTDAFLKNQYQCPQVGPLSHYKSKALATTSGLHSRLVFLYVAGSLRSPAAFPMSIKIDLGNQVRQTVLPQWKPLLPLFEAVMNSFQAIRDAKLPKGKGHVTIGSCARLTSSRAKTHRSLVSR